MKRIKIYILVLLCFACETYLQAQQSNDSVFRSGTAEKIRLADPSVQKITTLKNRLANKNLLLFVFISPECPICKSYAAALNALQRQYAESVNMIGIVPGRSYSNADINAFARKYKTIFPLLIDTKKELSNYLQAAITPEVVLLNNRYELIYRGAIDNSVTQLGGPKSNRATEQYLEDAISKYLQHSSIAIKRIKAVGCRINDF